MKFQGEVLDYFNVQKVVSNVFGGVMHAKRIQSVASAALGVIASESLIIHRIGRGLAKANNLSDKHAIKQVDRLLRGCQKITFLSCKSYFLGLIV